MERIFVDKTRFIDEYGRERIFSGINCVDKGAPGKIFKTKRKYTTPLKSEFIADFKRLGFNLVRLGIVWDAVETQPGQYNDEYLDKIVKLGKELEENGIYFYLDMHQDLYGPKTGGDGAPAWATLTDGEKSERKWFVWAEPYFAGRAVSNAFRHFWNNDTVENKGLWEHYLAMWQHVISKFDGNTALIGYDFLNEPFPPALIGKNIFAMLLERVIKILNEEDGKQYKPLGINKILDEFAQRKGLRIAVTAMLKEIKTKERLKKLVNILGTKEGFAEIGAAAAETVRKFDEEYYTPFIYFMAKGIRKQTDKGIMFLENSYYSNLGIPYCAKPIEYNGIREPQQAFAPHGYDLLVDSPLYRFASANRTDVIFNQHKLSQERLQMPVIVGEWGGSSNGIRWHAHLKHLLSGFEENLWSNTYWCFQKNLLTKKSLGIDVISRPYPQAVCGKILSSKYNRNSDTYSLEFNQEHDFDTPTQIYLHKKFKHISADGKYKIDSSGGGTLLKLFTEKGMHKLTVSF